MRRSLLVRLAAVMIVACDSTTGPSAGNCDNGAGFNFRLANTSIVIPRPGMAIRDLEILRDTAQGPVHFDILRRERGYGSGEFLDSLGLWVIFAPNPAGGTMTRLEVQHIGSALQTYSNETMYIRAFVGAGATAKECYRRIQVTVN